MIVRYVADPRRQSYSEQQLPTDCIETLWRWLQTGQCQSLSNGESAKPGYKQLGRCCGTSTASVTTLLAAAARTHEEGQKQPLVQQQTMQQPSQSTATERAALRKELAELRKQADRLDARAIILQNSIGALSQTGRRTTADKNELETVLRKRSAVETQRIAAEQQLEQLTAKAHQTREQAHKRLQRYDRKSNRQKQYRQQAVDRWYPAFKKAVAAIDPTVAVGETPTDYAGDKQIAQYAAISLSAIETPVLLEEIPFASIVETAKTLNVPVVVPKKVESYD